MRPCRRFAPCAPALAAPLTRKPKGQSIGAHWAAKLSRNLQASAAVAARQPSSFIDLRFRDLIHDPIAEMRRLYAFIDRSFDTRAQRAMQAYRQRMTPTKPTPITTALRTTA